MTKKYIVTLSESEQEMLIALIASGTQRVRRVTYAHILLKAHAEWSNQQIGQVLHPAFRL